MADDIEIEIDEKGQGTNRLIDALNRLADQSERTDRTINKLTGSIDKFGNQGQRTANETTTLSRALSQTSTGFNTLAAAAGTAFAALSVGRLIQYADGYTAINNRLKLVTDTQAQTNRAMDASFKIAQDTRQSWDATAGIYSKVQSTLKDLNMEQSKTAPLTSTINKAVALVSTSAESAKNGLYQFQQGLASGVLRGEEFNSVMENTPGLAQALAAGVKEGATISLGALRNMANNGELTTKVLIDALERVGPTVARAFAQSVPTVSQSFQVAENALMRFLGKADETNGISAKLAQSIMFLASNIDTVAPIVITLVGAMGALAAVQVVMWAAGVVSSLKLIAAAAGVASAAVGGSLLASLRGAAVGAGLFSSVVGFGLAGPLLAIAGVIAAVTAALYALGFDFGGAGKSVLNFIATLDSGDPTFGRIAAGIRQVGSDLNTTKGYWESLPGTVKNADGTLSLFNDRLKATGTSATSAGASVGTSVVSVVKAGEAYKQTGINVVTAGNDIQGAGVKVLSASQGFEVLSQDAARVPAAMTSATAATDTNTAALSRNSAGIVVVGNAHNQNTAALNQSKTAIEANNISLLGSIWNWLTASDTIGRASTSVLNFVRSLFGYTALVPTVTAATEGTKASIAGLNASLGYEKYAWDEATKSITLKNAALGGNVSANAAAAGANDNTAKSAHGLSQGADKASDSSKKFADTLKELQASSSQAAQQSQQLASSFNSLVTSAGGVTQAANAISNALRDGYSSAAGMAAQQAATLADALYGSGSAAASASGQYNQAAAAADNYAASASRAASAASSLSTTARNFGSQNPYSSGGTSAGTFQVNATEQFEMKFKGVGFGNTTYEVGMQAGYHADAVSRPGEDALRQAKNIQRNLDQLASMFPDLTPSEAMLIASSPGNKLMDQAIQRYEQNLLRDRSKKQYEEYAKNFNDKVKSINPTATAGLIPGFANGGSMRVGGNGGTDSQLVQFYASPNEHVDVRTPSQMRRDREDDEREAPRGPARPIVIKAINIQTKDEDSFRRTRNQQYADFVRGFRKAM